MLKTEAQNDNISSSITKQSIDTEIRELMEAKAESIHEKDEEFNPFSAQDIVNVVRPENQFNDIGFTGQPGISSLTGKKGKDSAELRQVDELLASVPKAQGFYLKLMKEIGVNEWQLKMRIDNYEFWSDLEWEITKIVREQTKHDSLAYGTGKYQIVVWNESGMRGTKRPPITFHIDAQESKLSQTTVKNAREESVEDKLEGMAKLVNTMQNFMPKPADPATQSQQLADAFRQGQMLSTQKEANDTNALATMMTAMMQMQAKASADNMQMMMLMLQNNKPVQDTGNKELMNLLLAKVLGDNSNKPDPSMRPIAMIKELREAGMIPKKDEGGLGEQLKTILALKDIAGEMFGGDSDKPSGGVLDKLLSGIGEKLPDIIGNVTGAINNVVALNKAKLAAQAPRMVANPPKGAGVIRSNPATQGQAPIIDNKTAVFGNPVYPPATEEADLHPEIQEPMDGVKDEEKVNFMVMMFANQLNTWVKKKDHTPETFDKITNATLRMTEGKPVIQEALRQGTMQPEDMAKMIVNDLDKVNYKTEDDLASLLLYCQAYANYIIGDDGKYIVECNICGQQYNFVDAAEFDNLSRSEQFCDEEGCDGELIPLSSNPAVESSAPGISDTEIDNNTKVPETE